MSAQANEVSDAVFVARQPIFDEENAIWGYELLFRASGEARQARVTDEEMATARVIADGFILASQGMKKGQRALVNFPRELIVNNFAYALPDDIAVIEILEDVSPDPEVLQAIAGFKESGYMVAMDDYMGEPELEPFLKYVDIIKVDILGILGPEGVAHAGKLREVTELLQPLNVKLLAEKVEDNDVYELCRELGYSLFQGFYFSKPEIIPGKKLSTGEISKVQLLKELGSPEFDVNRLARIIQADVSLTYRLFRYINSAGMGVASKVESISRAITLLGQRQLAQWLRVVIMSDFAPTDKGREVCFMAVHRARFLELLDIIGKKFGFSTESMFLLGLFSLLDTLLGQPMEEVLEQVPLEEELKEALLGRKGRMRWLLTLLTAYERGRFDVVNEIFNRVGVDQVAADSSYVEAMTWAQDILGIDEEH